MPVAATSAPPTRTALQRLGGDTFTQTQLVVALLFVSVQVPLAVVMRGLPAVATIHAITCALIGICYAATTPRVQRIAVVAAYVIGCEVLWRMSKAVIFWELAKYTIVAMFVVGLVRINWPRNRLTALAFFACLLPSIALTLAALDADSARQEISFTLAGPLALAVSVLFFSNVRLTYRERIATFLAVVAPVLGIGVIAFRSTFAQDDLEFVNASTAATSGGFGANQVSAILGLGVLLLLLLAIDRRIAWKLRIAMFGCALALAAQSTLTFARGGIVLALGAFVGAIFYLMRGNTRARITIVAVAIVTSVLGVYVIEPTLESMTKGELTQRYTNTTSSGRDLFIESELELFRESPLLGVGPGMGTRLRIERGLFEGASHTEYSRMLAEHGVFGALSIILFLVMAVRSIRQAKGLEAKAHATAMVIWVGMFFLVYGTRLAAPSFIFGLAFIRPRGPPT